MNAQTGDQEFRKYAPKRLREQTSESDQTPRLNSGREEAQTSVNQPPSPPGDERPYPNSGMTRFRSISGSAERNARVDLVPPPEPEPQRGEGIRLFAVAVGASALAILLVGLAIPLWQGKLSPFLSALQRPQDAAEQHASPAATATDNKRTVKVATVGYDPGAPKADSSRVKTAAATAAPAVEAVKPPAAAPAQQPSETTQPQLTSSLQSAGQKPVPAAASVRGVTDHEIRFGIAAPFSGPAKELGQHMKLGIEAAFNAVNASGGVQGRQLRLLAADDGYEPSRTADAMKTLYEKDQVFGVIGNVGTPTATVSLPYALDRKMLFFGAFTGSGLLRNDPPDRYAFNYRASYAEETAAVVHYLMKVKRLKPEQIAVFAQQDAYGEAGFAGVAKAIRSLGGDERKILRLGYTRNTVDVQEAVAQLQAHQTKSRNGISAVIMVPTYRAAARFIEKTRDLYPNMIYTSVSFVGSTALANELMLLGKKYAAGVIVTQVVPAVNGHSSLALDYKTAVEKYFPGETPDYVSFEGYVAANILIAALKKTGPDLSSDKVVSTLENLRDLDIGLGTPVNFGPSEHQAVHKVWGSQLDEEGHYHPIELE